jgi:hypothetical protein
MQAAVVAAASQHQQAVRAVLAAEVQVQLAVHLTQRQAQLIAAVVVAEVAQVHQLQPALVQQVALEL